MPCLCWRPTPRHPVPRYAQYDKSTDVRRPCKAEDPFDEEYDAIEAHIDELIKARCGQPVLSCAGRMPCCRQQGLLGVHAL